MYNTKTFESLVKSDLTDEEVYQAVIKQKEIKTTAKFTNDDEYPYGIFKGGVGPDDLVTVYAELVKFKFDDTNVYIKYIHALRENLKQNNGDFFPTAMLTAWNFSKDYFYLQDTPEAVENAKNFQPYAEKYRSLDNARNNYIFAYSTAESEEKDVFNTMGVYPMSKSVGIGDGAKCTEINATLCNLVNFVGVDATLVLGYMDNNPSYAHTFVLYKGTSGKYCFLDKHNNMKGTLNLDPNTKLEDGFHFSVRTFHHPITEEPGQFDYSYHSKPQAKVFDLTDDIETSAE
ncbi:MAG: hypothetical protein J6A28_00395 [Clostridia bacterium]|nr:hypothetical protein [Clostridia bacterium]